MINRTNLNENMAPPRKNNENRHAAGEPSDDGEKLARKVG
jgi:hypothetical protein